MMELRNNELCVSFPGVHREAHCQISFQRTLRIPDDNREYPLPAGLGEFPLLHVDDYAETVPKAWCEHGGVFLPMFQSEAMWINFGSPSDYPFAVKIAAGKINAVTGEPWHNDISELPQDYVVLPEQPWLDGFNIRQDLIRQFVAAPLGEGLTAEGQITSDEVVGGLQFAVYPMKADYYEEHVVKPQREWVVNRSEVASLDMCFEMGLAPGGLMRQETYDDPYGLDAWDRSMVSRCFVHIANSHSFQSITGCRPPSEPLTADQYKSAGIPWFSYWDDEVVGLEGSKILAGLDSVATKKVKQGKKGHEPTMEIEDRELVKLGRRRSEVRDGNF